MAFGTPQGDGDTPHPGASKHQSPITAQTTPFLNQGQLQTLIRWTNPFGASKERKGPKRPKGQE